MANAWGELSWNAGNWSDQNNATVSVTGFSNSIAQGTVLGFPTTGWGALYYGAGEWGELSSPEATVTGQQQNLSISHSDVGFGQLEWSAYNTRWGGEASVNIAINQEVNVSGQQLNIQNLGTLNIEIATEVFLANNPLPNLTIAEGTIDPAPDAEVTGNQLNTSLGDTIAYNRQGWGRYYWGEEEWGTSGLWEFVQLNNTNLGLGVTSGIRETWGQDEWGATTTEWGGNSVTDVDIKTFAEVTGIGLTSAEGIVDPSPDATVIGIGLTASIAIGSVVEADANVTTTGNALEIAQGQAELEAVTIASPAGQQLNISLNSIVAGASAEVGLTGIQLNVALGNEVSQVWRIVDTGTTVAYTEVSTGSSVTWNEIDTAA